MTVILGSSSPRRKYLLGSIITDFKIEKPETDESVLPGETAHEYCMRVAKAKREALLPLETEGDVLLISCDTTVSFEDHILGKPEDIDDAIRMLSLLQGNTHQVLSALAIYARIGEKELRDEAIESTDVTFRKLDTRGIESYLREVHVLDKAGAYAAQERPDMIIESINGSRTNVIGLPMRLIYALLINHGIMRSLFPDVTRDDSYRENLLTI